MRRLLLGLGLAWLATLALNRAIVEVRGGSMEPTLLPGERLLTVPARPRWVRTGRLVVVDDPRQPDHSVVKRIASVQADHVDVRGDAPYRSTDSRHWGLLPRRSVRRVVVARWPWPARHATTQSGGRRAISSSSGSSSPTSPGPRRP